MENVANAGMRLKCEAHGRHAKVLGNGNTVHRDGTTCTTRELVYGVTKVSPAWILAQAAYKAAHVPAGQRSALRR